MKKTFLFVSIVLSVLIAGCGERFDESVVQNPSKEEMSAAKARRDEVFAIYDRAGGKWENMSPEDHKRLLELSGNNEAMAQQGWGALGKMSRN